MDCPRCGNEMSEVVKHSVVIDVCAGCGGMWLDKGEMAKIVGQIKEAESALNDELSLARGKAPYRQDAPREERRYEHDRQGYDRDRDKHHGHKQHKKSGFDIFD